MSCSPGAGGCRPLRSHAWRGEHNQAGSGCSLSEGGHLGALGPQHGLREPSADSSYGGNMTLFPLTDFVTKWIVAHQAPLSMGFSRQECCSGFPCLPPWDLPDPGIKPASLRLLHHRRILHCWVTEEARNTSHLLPTAVDWMGFLKGFFMSSPLEPRNVTLFGKVFAHAKLS